MRRIEAKFINPSIAVRQFNYKIERELGDRIFRSSNIHRRRNCRRRVGGWRVHWCIDCVITVFAIDQFYIFRRKQCPRAHEFDDDFFLVASDTYWSHNQLQKRAKQIAST